MSNNRFDTYGAGRFRLYIESAKQCFEFFTLKGARAYLSVYHADTGKSIDYYSIFDKEMGQLVEAKAGRTEWKNQIAAIAAEAWNDIIGNIVVCSCSPEQYQQAVSRIQAAIEKARGIKTTEYAKGWDDHVATVRAAHRNQ